MKTFFTVSAVLAFLAGIGLVWGGAWGLMFTYDGVARENITTPADASIPNTPVRGPFTLKSQADVIRKHMLTMAKGQTFAEMPREIPKLDQNGKEVLDAEGKPVMVVNSARNTWITAATLINSLYMAIAAYAFSGFALFLGLAALWMGFAFWVMRRQHEERSI